MTFVLTMQLNAQNVSVNNETISTSEDNGTNVIILEETQPVEGSKDKNLVLEAT